MQILATSDLRALFFSKARRNQIQISAFGRHAEHCLPQFSVSSTTTANATPHSTHIAQIVRGPSKMAMASQEQTIEALMKRIKALEESLNATTGPNGALTPSSAPTQALVNTSTAVSRYSPSQANEPDEQLVSANAFRFLDLPDAVRNRIYRIAVRQFSAVQTLAYLRLPPLCAVSKQIRLEVMPVFFATTTFKIYTVGDFAYRMEGGHGDEEKSGVLHLSARAEDILANAGNAVFIHHTIIRVCNCDAKFIEVILAALRPSSTGYELGQIIKKHFPKMYLHYRKETRKSLIDEMLTVSVDFLFEGNRVVWSRTLEDRHPDKRYLDSTQDNEVDSPIRDMVVMAIQQGKRAGFKGFTIADLQALLKRLRYEHLQPKRTLDLLQPPDSDEEEYFGPPLGEDEQGLRQLLKLPR